jgi:hypothetical protein
MTYLRTKFHTPSSSDSLVVAIKPKAKENVRTAAMLLFYILYTKKMNKTSILFEDLLPHIN